MIKENIGWGEVQDYLLMIAMQIIINKGAKPKIFFYVFIGCCD